MHQLTLSLHCNHWKIQNRDDSHDAINSIRRSANGQRRRASDGASQWRQSFMASFVLSPFADAQTCL